MTEPEWGGASDPSKERFTSPVGDSPEEAEGQKPASYHFVLTDHNPSRAPEIAESLRPYRVIAIESVAPHLSAVARRLTEQNLTSYVSSSTSPEVKEQAEALITDTDHDRFVYGLIKPLAGTDKQVRLIDMSKDDHEAEKAHELASDAHEMFWEDLRDNQQNVDLRGELYAWLRYEAQSVLQRDKVVKTQLEALGREFPGEEIGVVTGKAHTANVREMQREGFSTSREFVGEDAALQEPVAVQYLYADQIVRQQREKPGSSVAPELLNRALLEQTFDRFRYTELLPDSETADARVREQYEIRARVTGQMSDEEVKDALDGLDRLKGRYEPNYPNRNQVLDPQIQLTLGKVIKRQLGLAA